MLRSILLSSYSVLASIFTLIIRSLMSKDWKSEVKGSVVYVTGSSHCLSSLCHSFHLIMSRHVSWELWPMRANNKIYTLYIHSCHSDDHEADQATGHQAVCDPVYAPGNTFKVQHLFSYTLLSCSFMLLLLSKHNFSLRYLFLHCKSGHVLFMLIYEECKISLRWKVIT
jgi:hypothetical protein